MLTWTKALAVTLALACAAPASAAQIDAMRMNADHNALLLPNGKAVPLSGVVTARLHPKDFLRTSPTVRGLSGPGNNVLVTHIDGPFPANEPAVAVDPRDPSHLIGAANDYRLGYDGAFVLYSSRNGGASWLDKVGQYVNSGPYYYQASGDPAVGIDDLSIDYFSTVSFDRDPNTGSPTRNAIVVARSTPGEQDRYVDAIPTVIDEQSAKSPYFDDKDALAVDNASRTAFNGSVYSTFTAFHFFPTTYFAPIVESYSRDHGSTFSHLINVSRPGGSALCLDGGSCRHNQGSSPVVGPRGEVFVAYENFDTPTVQNQILVSASTDGGQTFGRPVKVAADYDIKNPYKTFRVNSFPNLAVNPTTGQLYVAWADQRTGSSTIYVATSTNAGRSWSTPQAVAAPYFGSFRFMPAIGVQPGTGNVYLAFYDNAAPFAGKDRYAYVYRKYNAGLKALTPVTRVSFSPIIPGLDFQGTFFGDYTELAVSPRGATLFWTGTQTGAQDIESANVL